MSSQPKPTQTFETGSGEVLLERDGHLAIVTLNAPERMNTISGAMLDALGDTLKTLDKDPEVTCMLLTGAGDRAFCAGLDLSKAGKAAEEGGSGTGMNSTASSTVNLDLDRAPPTVLFNMDTPIICALNGAAAGYGLEIAMGCDIRVAAEHAKLSAAFVKRGIVPESGGTWLLPRIVGRALAAEIILTGRTYLAPEAKALGLVNHVVPAGELMGFARGLAEEIAGNPPLATQAAKRMMRMAATEPFDEHVHHVFLQLLPLLQTEDFQEAVSAFMEKRPPVFKGR